MYLSFLHLTTSNILLVAWKPTAVSLFFTFSLLLTSSPWGDVLTDFQQQNKKTKKKKNAGDVKWLVKLEILRSFDNPRNSVINIIKKY
jgi:hypothetical protein